MPSYQPVIALVRGLEILRVVNDLKQASVKAINERTGLDKATIVRMLETLEHEGYVARHKDQPIYEPTGRTLLLSQGYDRHQWIGAVAEPILNAFRNRIGWPSDMAIRDRDSMVVVQPAGARAACLSIAGRASGPRCSARRSGAPISPSATRPSANASWTRSGLHPGRGTRWPASRQAEGAAGRHPGARLRHHGRDLFGGGL